MGVRGNVELFPHKAVWSSCHLHLAASGPSTEDFSSFCLDSALGEQGNWGGREGEEQREKGEGVRGDPGCFIVIKL